MRALAVLLVLMLSGCSFAVTSHGLVMAAGNGYVTSGPACPVDVVDADGNVSHPPEAQPGDCTEAVSNGFSMPFVESFLAPIGQALSGAVQLVLGFFGKAGVP